MNSFLQSVKPPMSLSAIMLAALVVGCGGGGDAGPMAAADTNESAATVSTSTNSADNVVTGTQVTLPFAQAMDPTSINSSQAGTQPTVTLKDATGNDVPGTVAMNAENTEATFTPSASALTADSLYVASVSTAAKTADGSAMAAPMVVSFKTKPVASTSQAPVRLGAAGTFALLSKSGITNVFASVINGDVGASPITGAAIGLTCGEVKTGKIYSVDAAGPLPCRVTNATLLTSAGGNAPVASPGKFDRLARPHSHRIVIDVKRVTFDS